MQWKYWIPHVWEPADARLVWADVLILPDDPTYTGKALFITVDAVLNAETYQGGTWPKWRHRQIRRMGDHDFFMDRELMDLAVRAHDFSREECLEWIARWLRQQGLAVSGFVASDVATFKDRSEMGGIADRLQRLDTEGEP